jgi:Uma2 family endonuclease
MTSAVLGDRGLPWTEEDYLALGETRDRVELFDGSLLVSPAPTPKHQTISVRLYMAIEAAVNDAGLEVYEAINIRLRPGRIPIPDLAVVEPIDPEIAVVDVASVQLVAEIVSPSNPGSDRLLKMGYYAEAGIPWYLLIEPEEPPLHLVLRLFRLATDKYIQHALAVPGTPLTITEPFELELDPAVLVARR